MSYDSIVDCLSFSLTVNSEPGPSITEIHDLLQRADPSYEPDSGYSARASILKYLERVFARAFSHPPSRFAKGIKFLVKNGFCPQFDESELSNPAFFARQLYSAARGSSYVLGEGMGDISVGQSIHQRPVHSLLTPIKVTFMSDVTAECCKYETVELGVCAGTVDIPLPVILTFLEEGEAAVKPGSEIATKHDALDWFLIRAILTQIGDYGRL